MSQFGKPRVRAGLREGEGPGSRLLAYFPDAAMGNSAIQFLLMLGVRSDQLGVTTPSRMPRGQGMLLSIAAADPALLPKIEDHCRRQGAHIHRESRPSTEP